MRDREKFIREFNSTSSYVGQIMPLLEGDNQRKASQEVSFPPAFALRRQTDLGPRKRK